MANVDRPNGLRPKRMTSGEPYNGGFTKMYCAADLLDGKSIQTHLAIYIM